MADEANFSLKDERSTHPYNEDKVSSPDVLERLKEEHPDFKGDWSHLELLVRNLDADARLESIEASERLAGWNGWRERNGVRPHLEGARLFRAHLEGADLGGAHLDGADLVEAHLEGANLHGAHLAGAKLWESRLEKADMRAAHLEGASLARAHLEGADLSEAHLERANLQRAHLDGANLRSVRLDEANLDMAHLGGANLYGAHLERARLKVAQLQRACLCRAHLERAFLFGAHLDRADVRDAKGLRFDDNPVDKVRIDGDAPDPWSMLRRRYTGPWFFVHLALLAIFFTPYIARFLYLSMLSSAQTELVERSNTICEGVSRLEQSLVAIGERHSQRAPWLKEACESVAEVARREIAELQQRTKEHYRQTPALLVLIGWTGSRHWFVIGMIVIGYNVCRAFLTLRVSALRDAEERSKVTPALKEYWPLYRVHRVAKLAFFVVVLSTAFHFGEWAWRTKVYVPVERPTAAAQSATRPTSTGGGS